jgi:molecular chaperone GrpE (heat shock protein)
MNGVTFSINTKKQTVVKLTPEEEASVLQRTEEYKKEYDAQQSHIASKLKDIENNLPSWKEIADEYELLITDAQTARDTLDVKALATVIIKMLRRSKKAERILYWLAKNSAT